MNLVEGNKAYGFNIFMVILEKMFYIIMRYKYIIRYRTSY